MNTEREYLNKKGVLTKILNTKIESVEMVSDSWTVGGICDGLPCFTADINGKEINCYYVDYKFIGSVYFWSDSESAKKTFIEKLIVTVAEYLEEAIDTGEVEVEEDWEKSPASVFFTIEEFRSLVEEA